MRISDWSSDVCSSDLLVPARPQFGGNILRRIEPEKGGCKRTLPRLSGLAALHHQAPFLGRPKGGARRFEGSGRILFALACGFQDRLVILAGGQRRRGGLFALCDLTAQTATGGFARFEASASDRCSAAPGCGGVQR